MEKEKKEEKKETKYVALPKEIWSFLDNPKPVKSGKRYVKNRRGYRK